MRRHDPRHRCSRCRMHRSLCLCALIPRLVTRTRLLVVMHRFEHYKPSNTGRLATECLVNSALVVRGDAGRDTADIDLPAGTQPLVLFPEPNARELESVLPELSPERPVTLIVPDGSWRQAARMRRRVPALSALPCIALGPGEPSQYRLRRERDPRHLSTIEAIARAFGILEGPQIRAQIERPFRAMIDRALWLRGSLDDEDVSGGIPEGAQRHDPASGLAARKQG